MTDIKRIPLTVQKNSWENWKEVLTDKIDIIYPMKRFLIKENINENNWVVKLSCKAAVVIVRSGLEFLV